MSRALTLTTHQMQLGLLVAHRAGPLFVPWRVVVAVVGAFLLLLTWRLALDTVAAASLLRRLVAVNLAYHLAVLLLGVQVVAGWGRLAR